MSIHDHNALSIPRRLEAWVAEYEAKVAAIPAAIADFEAACRAIKSAACVGGAWGEERIADETAPRPAKRASNEVSKDLQYYPTPVSVVQSIVANLSRLEGARVLEPSCGCGRFMDALRKAGAHVIGCEVDPMRAARCEAKGHRVMRMNFLDTAPDPAFDMVVMNPPFYGKHYAKHIRHALRFLKPGGTLTAILPATARYDHGLLDDLKPSWRDLEAGAFSESGTNICTTVCTIRKATA